MFYSTEEKRNAEYCPCFTFVFVSYLDEMLLHLAICTSSLPIILSFRWNREPIFYLQVGNAIFL